jgi:hypothetical protein
MASSSEPEPPLRLPSPDEIRAQDIFNNCAVRTAVSGVMGELGFSSHGFLNKLHGFDRCVEFGIQVVGL